MANAEYVITAEDKDGSNCMRVCEQHLSSGVHQMFQDEWYEITTHRLNPTAGFPCDLIHEEAEVPMPDYDWLRDEDLMVYVKLPIGEMVSPRVLVVDSGMRWGAVLTIEQGVIGDAGSYACINGDVVADESMYMYIMDIFGTLLAGDAAPESDEGWVFMPARQLVPDVDEERVKEIIKQAANAVFGEGGDQG